LRESGWRESNPHCQLGELAILRVGSLDLDPKAPSVLISERVYLINGVYDIDSPKSTAGRRVGRRGWCHPPAMSGGSPCRHRQQGLCDRFFGCYVVAEYRLVSPNIVRCYFEVNAARETSNSRPLNHQLTPTKSSNLRPADHPKTQAHKHKRTARHHPTRHHHHKSRPP
jgi:hypothetical protein